MLNLSYPVPYPTLIIHLFIYLFIYWSPYSTWSSWAKNQNFNSAGSLTNYAVLCSKPIVPQQELLIILLDYMLELLNLPSMSFDLFFTFKISFFVSQQEILNESLNVSF